MTDGKKIDGSAHIGDAGIALIHARVSAMGDVWIAVPWTQASTAPSSCGILRRAS